ncbi:MAG: nucleotidyltransferase family protein, partial [Candidatus Eremiobacterota bacterium]
YVLLDLHWYITDERLSDNYLMEFRANAKEVNLKGHQVLIPSTEDLIFYLSLHAINYGHFVTIKYLYDLHRMVILYNKKIDWPEVVRKAKENKLEKILFYSLSFSRDFFETPVPEEVLKATEPCFVKDLFVRQWLNKDNILKRGEYIISSWIWEFFVSNLLYTDNFFDYLELIVNRRFLPVENYFEFSYKEQHMPPGIYLKKLLLKGLKCFFKIGNRVYG